MSDPKEVKTPTHYTDHTGNRWAHGDRMWTMYREAWFVGNLTKYVTRYQMKDGLKDLYKAKDYLIKLISLEKEELARYDMEHTINVSIAIKYLEMGMDILDKLIEQVGSRQDLPFKQEIASVVHRQQEDITDKTYCGMIICPGVSTTNVPIKVTCQSCIEEVNRQYYAEVKS